MSNNKKKIEAPEKQLQNALKFEPCLIVKMDAPSRHFMMPSESPEDDKYTLYYHGGWSIDDGGTLIECPIMVKSHYIQIPILVKKNIADIIDFETGCIKIDYHRQEYLKTLQTLDYLKRVRTKDPQLHSTVTRKIKLLQRYCVEFVNWFVSNGTVPPEGEPLTDRRILRFEKSKGGYRLIKRKNKRFQEQEKLDQVKKSWPEKYKYLCKESKCRIDEIIPIKDFTLEQQKHLFSSFLLYVNKHIDANHKIATIPIYHYKGLTELPDKFIITKKYI